MHLHLHDTLNDTSLAAYDFYLPPELIAQRPAAQRDHSRLLVYERQQDKITHTYFHQLAHYLPHNTQLILNQSKVVPCRLLGQQETGGKCEIFLLSFTAATPGGWLECFIKCSGRKKLGDKFLFPHGVQAQIAEILPGGRFGVNFQLGDKFPDLWVMLEKNAQVPIPPYIRNGDSDEQDRRDYQTVYAEEEGEKGEKGEKGEGGSVAAPTAGLHFTPQLLQQLEQRGHSLTYLTLHVGAGTFAPIRTPNILEHKMHQESFFLTTKNYRQMLEHSGPKIAVGTTSLRVLESIGQMLEGEFLPQKKYSTDIFLHPGSSIQSVQGLITNFHLPQSSLIILVSALLGRTKTLQLYAEAIDQHYRFFSYGDAMLILL